MAALKGEEDEQQKTVWIGLLTVLVVALVYGAGIYAIGMARIEGRGIIQGDARTELLLAPEAARQAEDFASVG